MKKASTFLKENEGHTKARPSLPSRKLLNLRAARLLTSGIKPDSRLPTRACARNGGCWELVAGYSGATASDFHGLPFACPPDNLLKEPLAK